MRQLAEHLRGPGALRLILALVVFVHHLSRVAIGTAAVYVFFVLSGFWIWRMWESRYAAAQSPYKTFLVSRMWRLLPVFLVANLLTIIGFATLVPHAPPLWRGGSSLELAQVLVSNLFILGYGTLPFGWVGPAWSLDVEVQFYLVAPLAIAWLARAPAAVMAAALGLAVGALWLGARGGLPVYLVFFLFGMAAARAAWMPSRRLAFGGLATMVGAMALCLVAPGLRDVIIGGAHRTAMHDALNIPFNLLLAVLVVPYALWTTGRRGGRHDGLAADMAYIVYLLHWIGTVVLATHTGHLPHAQRLPWVLLCVVGVLGVSYLVWRYIDRPANRLRQRYVERCMQPVDTVTARPAAIAIAIAVAPRHAERHLPTPL